MCKYCKLGTPLKDIQSDLHEDATAFIDDDDNEFTIVIDNVNYFTGEMDNLYINIPINYCPMCGRQLNEQR